MNIHDSLVNKVRENLVKYNMVSTNETICIGLSGGADSMTLLTIMNELKDEFEFKIVAAHVNHGIREEARDDADFCRNICSKLGVPFFEKDVKVKEIAKEMKLSEEEAGREVRYSFFRELGDKIATAHNKNDNVETIFMRLIRGTGLNGLSGIKYKNNNIIRPLLNVSRKEIEDFVDFCKIDYVTDKTNFQDIYTRNKIRLNVLPYIEKNINPNVINTIGDSISQFAEDDDCLDSIANDFFDTIKFEETRVKIYLNSFNSLHSAIKKRVLIKVLSKMKNSYANIATRKNIDDILSLIDKDNGKKLIFGDITIFKNDNFLYFDKSLNEKIELQIEEVLKESPITNTGYVCYVPACYPSLVLRERQPGDIVRIDDFHHKKLTDFLSDKKVPLTERKNIMVLAAGNEVFMIPKYFGTRFEKRTGFFKKYSTKKSS